MSKATFTIAYGGPALDAHIMDVDILVPSLLGLGGVFREANAIVNGSHTDVKLYIQAVEGGSFRIKLEVLQSLLQKAQRLFKDHSLASATSLASLIGFADDHPLETVGAVLVGGSLLQLLKFLKGSKPSKIETLKEGYTRFYSSDGSECIDVPNAVASMYKDKVIRKGIQKAIEEPLSKEGIDECQIRNGDSVFSVIEKSEAQYFSSTSSDKENIINETEYEPVCAIISLSFSRKRKWYVNDGNSDFYASMEDPEFLKKMTKQEVSFKEGDRLKCKIRIIQRDNGKNDYIIEKVIEHYPGLVQPELDE